MPPAPRLLVLHGLRVKGLAETPVLAAALGLSVEDTEPVLKELEREALVRRRDGRVSGWSLTQAGRDEHDVGVAADLEATGTRDALTAAYRRFLALNHGFLALCARSQTEPEAVDVDGELRAVHAAVRPVIDAAAAALPRFAPYGARLDHAADRVLAGEREWLTRPTIDSYHTVWFELHEDFLSTLGIQRGSE